MQRVCLTEVERSPGPVEGGRRDERSARKAPRAELLSERAGDAREQLLLLGLGAHAHPFEAIRRIQPHVGKESSGVHVEVQERSRAPVEAAAASLDELADAPKLRQEPFEIVERAVVSMLHAGNVLLKAPTGHVPMPNERAAVRGSERRLPLRSHSTYT